MTFFDEFQGISMYPVSDIGAHTASIEPFKGDIRG